MTIVIIGSGAVGVLVAHWLNRSAHQVALLARPATAQRFAAQPITLIQQNREQPFTPPVVTSDVATLPPVYQHPDLAILCVKSYDTVATLPTLTALQPRQVLTLQNGLGNEETLAAHLGTERVLAGVITTSIESHLPERLTITRAGGVGLAAMAGHHVRSPWSSALRSAGVRVRDYRDYRALKWSKVLLNMLGNATAAILDMPVDVVYADPRLVALERRAFLEALAVMQALGVRPVNLPGYPTVLLALLMRRLPAYLLFPLLRRVVAGGRGGKQPSLQRDMQQGRAHSEGTYLYGAVAQQATGANMTAPVNSAIAAVLNDIVSGAVPWDTFRKQPERLLAAVYKSDTQNTYLQSSD